MTLRSFRPQDPTSIEDLAACLDIQDPFTSALPAAFSDAMLVSLARDFRHCARKNFRRVSPEFVRAPLLIFNIVLRCIDGIENERVLKEERLTDAVMVYLRLLEQEIANRVTGVPAKDSQTEFVGALRGITVRLKKE